MHQRRAWSYHKSPFVEETHPKLPGSFPLTRGYARGLWHSIIVDWDRAAPGLGGSFAVSVGSSVGTAPARPLATPVTSRSTSCSFRSRPGWGSQVPERPDLEREPRWLWSPRCGRISSREREGGDEVVGGDLQGELQQAFPLGVREKSTRYPPSASASSSASHRFWYRCYRYPNPWAADRRDGIHGGFQHLGVMDIGRRQGDR